MKKQVFNRSCCWLHILRNASCFCDSRVDGCSIHISTHPHSSNQVPCSLFELRIESSILSALARQWSFAGVPFSVFVSFPNSLTSSLTFFLSRKRVGGRIRSLTLRVSRQLLTPKTTVPWLCLNLLHLMFLMGFDFKFTSLNVLHLMLLMGFDFKFTSSNLFIF